VQKNLELSRLKLRGRGRGRGLKKTEEFLEYRGRGRGPRAALGNGDSDVTRWMACTLADYGEKIQNGNGQMGIAPCPCLSQNDRHNRKQFKYGIAKCPGFDYE
jgi:hypothetical protein